MTDPVLSLFEEEQPTRSRYLARVVADSSDRIGWLRARSRGITATDVAKLSTPRSIESAARDKWFGTRFSGNAFTEHGKEREPEIARWVEDHHGIAPSTLLFHAEQETRHLATPDGLVETDRGELLLAEIKTTNKPWRSIPRNYLRQIWWQQYVLSARRTLFVWERHEDFVPLGEPECRWVDRDDNEINTLIRLAGQLVTSIETLARQHRTAYDH